MFVSFLATKKNILELGNSLLNMDLTYDEAVFEFVVNINKMYDLDIEVKGVFGLDFIDLTFNNPNGFNQLDANRVGGYVTDVKNSCIIERNIEKDFERWVVKDNSEVDTEVVLGAFSSSVLLDTKKYITIDDFLDSTEEIRSQLPQMAWSVDDRTEADIVSYPVGAFVHGVVENLFMYGSFKKYKVVICDLHALYRFFTCEDLEERELIFKNEFYTKK